MVDACDGIDLEMPAELHLLKIEDVVEPSKLSDANTSTQIENIINAINTRQTAIKSVHKNQVPFIAAGGETKLAAVLNFSPNNVIQELPSQDMNSVHIQIFGSHILNVPNSHYALGTIGTAQIPRLFATGVHVVHDPTFHVDASKKLVKASEDYINHGSIHLLRVRPGYLAKAWIGVKAVLLRSHADPYVINDPLFKFVETVNQNTALISHGNQHIVRVPSGKVALVWVGGNAVILEPRSTSYMFHTPFFSVAEGPTWFRDTTSKSIVHGSVKRLLPCTGEVAVCYDAGKLVIVPAAADGQPYIRDSQLFLFDGFLETNIATEVFPSERVKELRLKENPDATPDQINMETVTTKDSLKLGVKLMMSYKVADPYKLLSVLHRHEILIHIENVVSTDLSRAIQQVTSQEFLSFNSPNAKEKPPTYNDEAHQPKGPKSFSFVDRVKNDLLHDLEEIGIFLMRLNIESPKVLDKETSKTMENQSLLLARAAGEESVLGTQYKIAKQKAEQVAEVMRIEQEQKNQIVISAANAELTAQQARSEMIVIQAKAERTAAEMRGNQYRAQRELFELDMAKLQVEALKGAKLQLIVTPDEIRQGVGSILMMGRDPLQPGYVINPVPTLEKT